MTGNQTGPLLTPANEIMMPTVLKQAGHEPWFYWYVTALSAVALVTAVTMRDLKTRGTLD